MTIHWEAGQSVRVSAQLVSKMQHDSQTHNNYTQGTRQLVWVTTHGVSLKRPGDTVSIYGKPDNLPE